MESRKKKTILTIVKIGISIVLMTVLILFADIDRIISSLRNFNMLWLPVIFLLIALSVLISTFKWRILLKAQNIRTRFASLFGYYLSGLFFNNFLPSSIGGDGVRIYLTGNKSGNISAAAASVVVERVLATLTLALLGIGSAVFAQKTSIYAIILLIILFVVALLLAFVLLMGRTPGFLKNGNGKISKAIISFSASAGELRKHPKALLICLIESVLFQILVALVVGAVIKGLALPGIPLPDLFLVTSASSVLAMAPVGLNGYGMREGAYIYLLGPYGFSVSSALTVSVVFALFVSAFSLLGGISWMISHPSRNRKASENKIVGNVS